MSEIDKHNKSFAADAKSRAAEKQRWARKKPRA